MSYEFSNITTEYTEYHGVLLLSFRAERSVVKDLVDIHVDVLVDASEIRRFALDDIKILCGESS